MSETDDQEILAAYETASADIFDLIDENQIDSDLSYADLKENLEKIEKLRSTDRNVHARVGRFHKDNESFESQFEVTLKQIKQHILDVKGVMKGLRQKSNEETTLVKEKDKNFVRFLVKDLEIERKCLQSKISAIDICTLSDEALDKMQFQHKTIRTRLKDFHSQVMLLMESNGEDKSHQARI